MYWVFRTRIIYWKNQQVQAKLIQPKMKDLRQMYGPSGFRDPMQNEPYGAALSLIYQIDPRHPHPDNYFQDAGFTIYSNRLVELMSSFGVKAEVFPITMLDKRNEGLPELQYSVFHSLEGVLGAMDEGKSEWTGDHDVGVPRLVLDETKFENRPLFVCNYLYVPLMHDDMKQEIQRQGITGFAFLSPERYRSGSYGFPPDFDE